MQCLLLISYFLFPTKCVILTLYGFVKNSGQIPDKLFTNLTQKSPTSRRCGLKQRCLHDRQGRDGYGGKK